MNVSLENLQYDPESDTLQPLSVLARRIPNRRGKLGINVSSPWRWALKGLKNHKLRTQMVGGIRMGCGRWLAEFFAAVTAAANGEPAPVTTRKQREKEIAAAEKELAAAGI